MDEKEELPAEETKEMTEEVVGVISSVATGLWGAFFGTPEPVTPKPTPV